MKYIFDKIAAAVSGRRGAKVTLLIWLLAAVLVSGLSAGAKEYAVNPSGSDLPDEAAAVIASKEQKKHFPGVEGTPALLVFHHPDGIDASHQKKIAQVSEYLGSGDRPASIKEVLPYEKLPPPVQESLLSEDKTTLVLSVLLQENLEMKVINETVTTIEKEADRFLSKGLVLKVTGPAGIASDTIAIFSNADLVLLFATIGLILILMIVIYRSPLLAIIPLLIAGIVYQVVDRFLGWFAKLGWLEVDSQALSIMMILLFAALTDYSLFVFSRFREELKKEENKYTAMRRAMGQVGEPIFFSGGTVLAAMLVLFAAVYKPYQSFAPVFSIAMVFIILAGITLVPALFALFGRSAFWPFIPRVGQAELKEKAFWKRVASVVTRKPLWIGSIVFVLLLAFSFNMTQISYSFNLIKSFPEEMTSRQGFELLEKHYSPGELAPTTVLLTSKEEKISLSKVATLREELLKQPEVDKVLPEINPEAKVDALQVAGQNVVSDNGKVVQLELTFKGNPYDKESLDAMDKIRSGASDMLTASGFSAQEYNLQFAGETAWQADVRALNKRDTAWMIGLITLLITVLLAIQTRSLVAPLYMILTILISYGAAMGLSTLIFDQLGYSQMSYRIPLYTFVFLVALGVDYNIILMSRIKEEAKQLPIRDAIARGLAMTGGVISSAGLILAATFSVLMTQPILELFMFGFAVAVGILMDTFLVRGLLVPAIAVLVGRWNFWPSRVGQIEGKSVISKEE